ncbi:MAG: sporulation transcriptional regulator SpoIIID [Lachnospiraceae bacterium]|nr:sporulation transcriptional regulator SpoIIID [Lachnospiraceae bacterium]
MDEKIGGMRKGIERLEAILNSTFKQLEDITDVHEMTNAQLKQLINKIEVDKDGNVDIYLVLDVNKAERHLRGGLATKEKYAHQHEEMNK